jgi:thiol reductant ABC exporter CydC subunit
MSPLRRLWQVAAVPPARFALAVLLAVLSLGSAVALLATSAWLISRASQQPPILYLQVAIVAVRAFGISRGVFRYAERLVGHDAALRSLSAVRLSVFRRLERLSPAGLGGYRHGDLLARLVGDVDASVDLLVRVVLPGASALLVAGAAVMLAWLLLPAAGLVMLGMVVLVGVMSPLLTARIGARSERGVAAAQAQLSAEVVTGITAAADLAAFNATDAALDRITAADREVTDLAGRAASASAWGAALSSLATGAAVVGCLAVAVPAVDAGTLNGVNLAVLALLPLAVADALSGLPAAVLARSRVVGAASRVFAVIDAPDPVPPPVGPVVPVPDPPHSLVISGVSARYPQAGSVVLEDVSLDLQAAKLIGLVGPSGSGKSTLTLVALRFLAQSGGQVTVTGTDVGTLTEEDVRTVVGAMGQDAFLFDTTIAENIRLADRDADDERFGEVLVAAGLAQWLAEIPGGADTRVGAHGAAVSGGQRQRIALARMLLADRPIRILDEPTEHLELATGDALLADILAGSDRPTLLITHRMAATVDCDEVVVLDAGRVVQRGRPADLLAAGGPYRELCERESGNLTT